MTQTRKPMLPPSTRLGRTIELADGEHVIVDFDKMLGGGGRVRGVAVGVALDHVIRSYIVLFTDRSKMFWYDQTPQSALSIPETFIERDQEAMLSAEFWRNFHQTGVAGVDDTGIRLSRKNPVRIPQRERPGEPTTTKVGDEVVVYFGDGPAIMTGEVVEVIKPDDVMRVRVTSTGELDDGWSELVGQEHGMDRLHDLSDALYDDFLWSPTLVTKG